MQARPYYQRPKEGRVPTEINFYLAPHARRRSQLIKAEIEVRLADNIEVRVPLRVVGVYLDERLGSGNWDGYFDVIRFGEAEGGACPDGKANLRCTDCTPVSHHPLIRIHAFQQIHVVDLAKT